MGELMHDAAHRAVVAVQGTVQNMITDLVTRGTTTGVDDDHYIDCMLTAGHTDVAHSLLWANVSMHIGRRHEAIVALADALHALESTTGQRAPLESDEARAAVAFAEDQARAFGRRPRIFACSRTWAGER